MYHVPLTYIFKRARSLYWLDVVIPTHRQSRATRPLSSSLAPTMALSNGWRRQSKSVPSRKKDDHGGGRAFHPWFHERSQISIPARLLSPFLEGHRMDRPRTVFMFMENFAREASWQCRTLVVETLQQTRLS